LLKDKISEKYFSFDASLLPDGHYQARVVASDAPVHTEADTLTGERASDEFVVDTTPPVPGALTATMASGKIHATFSARDATSPIGHAEYSVDAGPWQYLGAGWQGVGLAGGALRLYRSYSPVLPGAAAGVLNPAEHVIAIRVYDRYDNVVA